MTSARRSNGGGAPADARKRCHIIHRPIVTVSRDVRVVASVGGLCKSVGGESVDVDKPTTNDAQLTGVESIRPGDYGAREHRRRLRRLRTKTSGAQRCLCRSARSLRRQVGKEEEVRATMSRQSSDDARNNASVLTRLVS